MKMRHNKKRNPALLYEFLVRHAAKCLIHNKQDEATHALSLSKKYFAKGQPLHEELRLFRNLLDTNVSSRHSAQKILNAVCDSAKNTNARNLDKEKSRIIKEVNYAFKGEDFYNYKVPGYTVYASIQSLLSESRNKKKFLTDVQRIKLEDVVCEHLVMQKEDAPAPLTVNSDYNNTVYGFVVKRFNKKYDQKLSEGQKNLLTNYAAYTISKNDAAFRQVLAEEAENIKQKLRTVKDRELRADADLMKKLNECYKNFMAVDLTTISDNTILEVLHYMQLADEVDS